MPDAAPFCARHRADLERWAAEGDKVSRLMLDTGLAFPEAVEELHRRLTGPVPVPDPDTEWR
jgi:hypothetical protein